MIKGYINNTSIIDAGSIRTVDCDSSVYVGAWVYLDSSNIAQNALADTPSNSLVIGVVEAKLSSTECIIKMFGITDEIFTGLDVTKWYYLSPTVAGGMTTTVPTGGGHILLVLGQPFTSTEFKVNVEIGARARRAF
jgi:hypothetical protein